MGQLHSRRQMTSPDEIVILPTRKYNFVPDRTNPEYQLFMQTAHIRRIPAASSVRAYMDDLDVFDQGELGSCTANAIAGALQFVQTDSFTPSRLFIYYNERAIEGTTDEDAGARISDGLATVQKLGACSESLWPYDIAKFDERPPAECYTHAEHVTQEARLFPQTLKEMKRVISMGLPVVFGVSVYASFESDKVQETGDVPMPSDSDTLLGGHAILAVGYDDATQRVTFRNSWGSAWGDRGYGTLPYKYFDHREMANSMWVVNSVEDMELD